MSKSGFTVKNKFVVGIVGTICLLVLAACGSSGGSDGATTLRAGVIYTSDVPIVRCGLETLAENKNLEEAGVEIQTTDSGQLGDENELLEQASDGQLDIGMAAGSTLATVFGIPELEMFEAYYLYDSVEDVGRVRETDVAQGAFDVLDDKANLHSVGNPWLYGERHIFGNRELKGSDDFNGLKLRVPETDISIESARALGADPTPTAYSELYLALQQGIVDAGEAPLSVIEAESFDEPSKYINLTGHLISAASPLINSAAWNDLSSEQQRAIEKAFNAASEKVEECVSEADQEALDKWSGNDSITVNDQVDKEVLKDEVQKVYSTKFEWSEKYQKLLKELGEASD